MGRHQQPCLASCWLLLVAASLGGLPGIRAQAETPKARPIERIDALCAEVQSKHGVPALGAALVDSQGLSLIGVAGVRRRGSEEAVTVNDRWHLGSCTKAMTATLCARLVERGLLAWDSKLVAIVPSDGLEVHPSRKDVTLERLLLMRAGMPADLQKDGLWGRLWPRTEIPGTARMNLFREVITWPAKQEDATHFEYSNASYALAGLMAETAAKKPFEDLLREELFAPLGMKSAGFGAPKGAKVDDEPAGHIGQGEKPVPEKGFADNPPAIAPAGTVHASLEDWAKFAKLHLDAAMGHPRWLEASSFERLHTSFPGGDYAMGFGVAKKGGTARALTHAGSNTMWYAFIRIDPVKGRAVLGVTNQYGTAGPKAVHEIVDALHAR